MSDLRILMIGPGKPSESNTGLGIAVHELAKSIAKEAHLIHVQPTQADQIEPVKETYTESDTFDVERVTKDLVTVAVRSEIPAYAYGPIQTDQHPEAVDPEMKKAWQNFTKDTLRQVEKYEFDVIYAHDWPSFQAGVSLKQKTGKPLVLHVHSLDVDRLSTNHRSWVYDVEKEGLEAADKIITVSKYSAERIAEFYGIPKERIEIVYNGVHAAFQRRSPNRETPLEPLVLYVGRLSGQKSPYAFLEIAEEVLRHIPDAKFVLAGSGNQRDNLIEFAANKKIGDKVYFAGYLAQEQLLKLYQQATVFCMPSKSDPFGLAALEAAAAGLPVVLSKQCGVFEVLPGAMAANYSEITQFAKFLTALLEDPELRAYHASKNQSSISLLTWNKAANEVLETLTEVTA